MVHQAVVALCVVVLLICCVVPAVCECELTNEEGVEANVRLLCHQCVSLGPKCFWPDRKLIEDASVSSAKSTGEVKEIQSQMAQPWKWCKKFSGSRKLSIFSKEKQSSDEVRRGKASEKQYVRNCEPLLQSCSSSKDCGKIPDSICSDKEPVTSDKSKESEIDDGMEMEDMDLEVPLSTKQCRALVLAVHSKPVGEGATADVHLVKDLSYNRNLALKRFIVLNTGKYKADPEHENAMLSLAIGAQGVIQCFHGDYDDKCFVPSRDTCSGPQSSVERACILMEFLGGGDLSLHTKRVAPRTPLQLIRQMRDMAVGVESLHELRIVHKDVKTENFFVGEESKNNDVRLVLGDLGYAQRYLDEPREDGCAKSEAGHALRNAGTIIFVPPELLLTPTEYSAETVNCQLAWKRVEDVNSLRMSTLEQSSSPKPKSKVPPPSLVGCIRHPAHSHDVYSLGLAFLDLLDGAVRRRRGVPDMSTKKSSGSGSGSSDKGFRSALRERTVGSLYPFPAHALVNTLAAAHAALSLPDEDDDEGENFALDSGSVNEALVNAAQFTYALVRLEVLLRSMLAWDYTTRPSPKDVVLQLNELLNGAADVKTLSDDVVWRGELLLQEADELRQQLAQRCLEEEEEEMLDSGESDKVGMEVVKTKGD